MTNVFTAQLDDNDFDAVLDGEGVADDGGAFDGVAVEGKSQTHVISNH